MFLFSSKYVFTMVVSLVSYSFWNKETTGHKVPEMDGRQRTTQYHITQRKEYWAKRLKKKFFKRKHLNICTYNRTTNSRNRHGFKNRENMFDGLLFHILVKLILQCNTFWCRRFITTLFEMQFQTKVHLTRSLGFCIQSFIKDNVVHHGGSPKMAQAVALLDWVLVFRLSTSHKEVAQQDISTSLLNTLQLFRNSVNIWPQFHFQILSSLVRQPKKLSYKTTCRDV